MGKYVIFGAAKQGTEVYHLVEKLEGVGNVAFFVDNDENRWGTKEGLEVIGAGELAKRDPDRKFAVIIASSYYGEIQRQLLDLGFAEENILSGDNLKRNHQGKEYRDFLEKYKVLGENLPIASHPLEIKGKFEEMGFRVMEYAVDMEDYEKWLEEVDYNGNYPFYAKTFGGHLCAKQFQHYVSIKLLGISENKVALDVASSISVFPEIVREKYGAVVYRQDIEYPWGVDGYTVGSFASDIPLPDCSVDCMTLHCSLEHFEDREDFKFFQEAGRILGNNGKVCVIPLYMADGYYIRTSPEVWSNKYKVYSECPKFDERAGIIIDNGSRQRQSKYYSVEILKEELLNGKTQMAPTVVYITNYHEIKGSAPFALLLEKAVEE